MKSTVTIHCDEEHEARMALSSQAMIAVIEDYLNELRDVWKYHEAKPTTTTEAAQEWSKKLHEMLDERSLTDLIYR